MKSSIIHFSIALVLTLLAIGGYVLWYGQVQQLATEVGTLQSEIAAKETNRTQSASTRSIETELATKEAFVASHLVRRSDIVTFLEQLEGSGKGLGATVSVASVSDQDKTTTGQISLSLSISGSFDAVMRTLGVIEEGRYANSVKDLSLGSSGEGGTWTATGIFVVGTESATTTP